MTLELIKDVITSAEETASGSTQLMVDGDIIVPDKKPDILKIAQVDANATVTGKEVMDNRILLSGRLDLKIMYIPDNDRDKLKSIITSFDFEHRIDKQGITPMCDAALEAETERVEYQLLNSRKLRIKSICRIDYSVSEINDIEVVTGVCGESEVCRKTVCAENVRAGAEREFSVKESIELASGKPSIAEILKVDINIADREYKALTSKAVAKGTVCVAVLYTAADGSIDFAEAQLPFTEVFEIDGMTEESQCDVTYSVSECCYDLRGDSDGDMRVVDIQLSVNARIRAGDSNELELISDIYVPGKITKPVFEKRRIEEVHRLMPVQNTLREIISVPKSAPRISGVYNVIAKAVADKAERSGTKLNIEGRIEAYILYICEESDNPVYSMKKDIPFTVSTECKDAAEQGHFRINVCVEHTSFNLTAANEVELRCILSVNAAVVNSYETDILVSCEVEEPEEDSQKGIVIYFVQPGETLWEIAKRYGVSRASLMELNHMEDENVSTGMRLLWN